MNETFRAPRGTAIGGVFCFILFAPIACGVLVGFPRICPPENRFWAFWTFALPMGLIFASFALLGIWLAINGWNGWTRLDSHGVTRRYVRSTRHVAWADVTKIHWSAPLQIVRLQTPQAKVSIDFNLCERGHHLRIIRALRTNLPHVVHHGWTNFCLYRATHLMRAEQPIGPDDVVRTRRDWDRTYAFLFVACLPVCALAGWYIYRISPDRNVERSLASLAPLGFVAVFWVLFRRTISQQGTVVRASPQPQLSATQTVLLIGSIVLSFAAGMLIAYSFVPATGVSPKLLPLWTVVLLVCGYQTWKLNRLEKQLSAERTRRIVAAWEATEPK